MPGASLPSRGIQELLRTPPAQSRDAPGGAAFGAAPQGAGAPAATGSTAQATAIEPKPAAPPAVSTSQAAKLAATVIALQAGSEAEKQEEADNAARDEQIEAVRESAVPRGTEQQSQEIRETRSEARKPDETAVAIAKTAEAADPSRTAAEKYRDANETTSAAKPARLLMDA